LLTVLLVGLFLLSSLRNGAATEEEITESVAELQESCRQSKASGDWRRLEREAQQWSELQPKRLEPWLLAADAARQQGNIALVAQYLSQTPNDCPIQVLAILGQLQLEELNQPLAAIATYQRILARFPDDLETHLRLLQIYSMTCQREEVIEQARKCIATGNAPPSVFAFLIAARWLVFSNGFDVNNQWLSAGEEKELFEVAAVLHLYVHPELKSMAQKAPLGLQVPTEYFEHQLRQVLKRYPRNPELLVVQLRQLSQRGDVTEVAKILANASAACGEDPRFWYFHGWYHSTMENWESAREAYQRALEIEPFDWLTWSELAMASRRTAGPEAARPLQEIALLGRDVTQVIRMATNMEAIDVEDFEKLADYFEACGDSKLAQQLRISLARSKSLRSVSSDWPGASR